MAKEIPLSKGYVTIVDDDDYEWLSKYKWHWCMGYAMRTTHISSPDGKRRTKKILMHREVMKCPEGLEVDHIKNKLDNQKANLRICTHAENMRNVSIAKNNTSGVKGVYWNKGRGKWQAQISSKGTVGKTKRYLGLFYTLEEATKAYNEAALKLRGDFANLNKVPPPKAPLSPREKLTQKEKEAIQLIEEYPGMTAMEFGLKFWPSRKAHQSPLNKRKQIGYEWLMPGNYLGKLKKKQLVYSQVNDDKKQCYYVNSENLWQNNS